MHNPTTALAFIVTDLPQWPDLANRLLAHMPHMAVEVIHHQGFGLSQMAQLAQQHPHARSVHVFSHGSPGQLHLGLDVLAPHTLAQQHAATLAALRQALPACTQWLWYGCNSAQGETGAALVQALAHHLGASMQASTTPTGHAALGGDWLLQHHARPAQPAHPSDHAAPTLAPPVSVAAWSGLMVTGITQTGTAGNDPLDGGVGDDSLAGLAGDDTLNGYGGADTLVGGDGYDVLFGGAGNDSLDGGVGNDTLRGGTGNNTLLGGDGDDLFVFDNTRASTEQDLITGGAGKDWFLLGGNDLATKTVTDFAGGATGDVIDVSNLPNASTGYSYSYSSGNPLDAALGYLRLVQSGAHTLVQWDKDGAAGSASTWQTMLTLNNTATSSLTAENFYPSMAPDGSNTGITQTGTAGDDLSLEGGVGNDSVAGLGGHDFLFGYGGADTLVGGDGSDLLNGGAGNDVLEAGTQGTHADTDRNYLYGEDGDDVLHGGEHTGELFFSYAIYGDDLLGGNGNDSLYGYAGNDSLYGDPGNDSLDGGEGSDSLDGGEGSDSLDGGAGNDTLYGGTGNNTLLGGDGDDVFYFSTFSGISRASTEQDLITGGAGKDRFVLNSYDLATKTVTDFAVGATGDVIDVSNLLNASTGYSYSYSSGNPLDAALGYLRLVQSGAHTLVQWDKDGAAGSASTWQTMLTLNNTAASSLTAENFYPSMAPDGSSTGITQTGTAGDDPLDGGVGNDSLLGLAGRDNLYGYGGADTLVGGDGYDYLNGGAGNDVLEAGTQGTHADTDRNYLQGDDGDDVLHGGEYISGGDTLLGDNGNDSLFGYAGDDLLIGDPGNDSLDGGVGNDTLMGGMGNNTLLGGDGDDRFYFSTFTGINGISRASTEQDLITGGAGNDWFMLYSDDLATKTVTDFAAGATGDVIDVSNLLNASTGYSSGNPLDAALGYLRLVQSGAHTLVQWDKDGAAGGTSTWQTMLTLNNTAASSLTAENFSPSATPLNIVYAAVSPVLNSSASPALPAVAEGALSPAGISVVDLVVDGSITSALVATPPEAIAITGLNTSLGAWQYSLDGGANWLTMRADQINSSTNELSLLLRPTDMVRMLPFGELNGTLSDAITFRAWDMSSGTAGEYTTIAATGGGTAFSAASDTASLVVNAVNDAPTFAPAMGMGTVGTNVGTGYAQTLQGVVVLGDGRVVVGGVSGANFSVERYNASGSLDSGFGSNGKVLIPAGSAANFANSTIQQADGKLVLAGGRVVPGYGVAQYEYSIVRLEVDGSMDSSFGTNGRVTILQWLGGSGYGYPEQLYRVIQQADGKLVLAGTIYKGSNYDYSIVRLNVDGSQDTSFGSDGQVIIPVGSSDDSAYSVIQQADGKLVLGGYSSNGSNNDYSIVRLNADGSRDTSFGSNGQAIIPVGSSDDRAYSVISQADGKLVLGGSSFNGSNWDYSIVRLNADGSRDATFGSNGQAIIPVGSSDDSAYSVIQQADGKLVLGGGSSGGGYSIVRLNVDGSRDTSFGSNGQAIIPVSSSDNYARSVISQADGKLVLGGYSYGINNNYSIVRLNADGSLDTTFGGDTPLDTLGASVAYTENASPVVLDSTVAVFDAELAALNGGAGNYAGSSITLARVGGADAQDVFSATGALSFSGSNVVLSGVTVGTFTQSAGTLAITFNAAATQAKVNQTLSAIGYSNTADIPPASVQIGWTFSDGNSSAAQGTGGALGTTGVTTVNITGVNDAPTGSLVIQGVVQHGHTLTASSTLADADGIPGAIAYQWQVGGVDVQGATGTSYLVRSIDIGKTITVAATFTDGGGHMQTVLSAATAAVQRSADGLVFPGHAAGEWGNVGAFAALRPDGSVVTWGGDYYGGNSSAVSSQLAGGVTQVFSNLYAFAALKADGSVVTWGNPSSGANSSAVADQLTSGVVNVFSTQEAFAALKADGSVVSWGSRIGSESAAVLAQLSSGVVKVYSTNVAFAAIKNDGSVVTWGGGGWGYGADSSAVASQLATGVVDVFSTEGAFAALKADGSVVTWGGDGYDAYGQDSSGVAGLLASGVVRIQSTRYAFAALKADGSVVVWGSAYQGGNASAVSSQLASGVVELYSTSGAFAALKADGSVLIWGNGGGTGGAVASQLTSGVVRMVSSSSGFAAIKTDGSVVCWGVTGYEVAETVAALSSGVVDVVANDGAFAALKSDGTVVAWGDSVSGGSLPYTNDLPRILDIDAVHIYANESAFAAVKADGSVVSWGSERYGGDSSTVMGELFDVVNVADIATHQNIVPDTVAPSLLSAQVDGHTLTLTYSEAMHATKLPQLSAFSVTLSNGDVVIPTQLAVNGAVVTLTLRNPVPAGAATLNYTDVSGANNALTLQDAAGNDAASVSGVTVNDTTVDIMGPAVTFATVHGHALVLSLDEFLHTSALPAPSAFGVRVNGGAVQAPVAMAVSGKSITLTLAQAVNDGDEVVLSYTDPSAANDAAALQDTYGNDMGSVANVHVSVIKALPANTAVYNGHTLGEWINMNGYAAIKASTGGVITWGYGNSSDSSAVAAQIARDVQQVYSSTNAFAALKADGSVVTWGDAMGGGDSSGVAAQLDSGVQAVFSTRSAFAALKANGSLVTWGNANAGGDSSAVASQLSSGVQQVFSTGKAFAALKTDGTVVTWGDASSGGNSTKVSAELTQVVQVMPGETGFAALRSDGSVVIWGAGHFLGVNGGDPYQGFVDVPDKLSAGVVRLYAGAYAFAALKADGSLVTWGMPITGGESHTVSAELASGVKDVVTNYSGMAALKDDGSVVTWGIQMTASESVKAQLLSGVLQVVGSRHSFAAVKADGSVVTWGLQPSGGDSSAVSTQLASGVVRVVSNEWAYAAIKADGSVVTWGETALGGDSSSVAGLLASGVRDVVSDGNSFAAIKTDGTVVTWGMAGGGNSSAVAAQLNGVAALSDIYTNQFVTAEGAAPIFVSMMASGTAVVLTFDVALDAVNAPLADAFAVKVNGGTVVPAAVQVTGKTVTLTLAASIPAGASVVVGYTDPTLGNDQHAVQDGAGRDGGGLVIGSGVADVLSGSAGAELMVAYAGNDTLDGGAGADTLVGGDGNDTYVVDVAGDVVTEAANQGTDTVQSGISYTLEANVENLVLTGNIEAIGIGNGLNNVLIGNSAVNTLDGGNGNDTLTGGAGNDSLDGGTGVDTASYSDVSTPVSVILYGNQAFGISSGSDNLVGIENIMGSAYSDLIYGDAADNLLDGGAGNDTLDGGLGKDTLLGQTGDDLLNGLAGNDSLDGGDGADTLYGWADADTLIGGVGADNLFGGAGADRLDGGADADQLEGDDGNDTLLGGAGNDTQRGWNDNDSMDGGEGDNFLFGGAGADVLTAGSGADALEGDDGNDTLQGGAGNDTLRGWNDSDSMDGGDGNDALFGGAGADVMQGGAGNDQLEGDDGNDTMTGSAGNDTLRGWNDNDQLLGEDGDDLLVGWSGNDSLNGGTGNDQLFGDDGADTLVGGAGGDVLQGGMGNDLYLFEVGFGFDGVRDYDYLAGNNDTFQFNGINKAELSFARVGDALKVDRVASGGADVIYINDWYQAGSNGAFKIETWIMGGVTFTAVQIEALVV